MPTKFIPVTLNGSGAITASQLLEPREGLVHSIRMSKNGQTNNPVVTISKSPSTEKLLNGVTLNADKSYYPRVLVETNAAVAATDFFTQYALGGQSIIITVTGGDAAGTIGIYLEWDA